MPIFRLVVNGGQVVEINHRWGYLWYGSPLLEIGERVWLPSSWQDFDSPWRGEVTGHGSLWDSEYKVVIRRDDPT